MFKYVFLGISIFCITNSQTCTSKQDNPDAILWKKENSLSYKDFKGNPLINSHLMGLVPLD